MNKYLFETDYSADILRWIKRVDERQLKTNPYSKDKSGYNPEDLEKFQNEIVQENDSASAFFFANEFGYKPHRMQKVILDKKDPKYAFMFAQSILNADIKALQNVVVESKKIKYISKFACFVKSADQKQLEPIILKSKNVKYAHMYLKHVKGANIDKLKEVILSSKKPRYLFELAKHTKNPKDLAVIEDLIIEASSFTYVRLLAEKIKIANVDKLEQAVLDTENSAEIKKFAKYVRRSKMKQFLLVV
jgi:hypothetical protein